MLKPWLPLTLLLSIALTPRAECQWSNPITFTARVTCTHFLDHEGAANIGLVGLEDGRIYRTSDSGKTWAPCTIPVSGSTANIESFSFKDTLTGWCGAFSMGSSCWKTTDGGITWNFLPLSGEHPGIYYSKTTRLLFITVLDDSSKVSSDEGLTWRNFAPDDLGGFAFLDSLHGVVTGDSSAWTDDGGTTWHVAYTPLLHLSWQPYAMGCTGEYYASNQTAIFRSTDFGISWLQVYDFQGFDNVSRCITGALGKLFVQTIAHGFYASTDRGISWTPLAGPNSASYTFYQEGSRIVAGDRGTSLWLYVDSTLNPIDVHIKVASIFARGGDTIDIPVYLSGNGTLTGATSLSLPFVLDTNVLRVLSFNPALSGVSVGTLAYSKGTETVPLQATDLAVDGETLIGTLRCIVYLADTLITSVSLAETSILSENSSCAALSLSTYTMNITIAGCGDLTLLNYMKNGVFPDAIASISPNPATSSLEIKFRKRTSLPLTYELIDALGSTRIRGLTAGTELILDVTSLPQCIYCFRVLTEDGIPISRKIAIER